jgi:hypothetical protein
MLQCEERKLNVRQWDTRRSCNLLLGCCTCQPQGQDPSILLVLALTWSSPRQPQWTLSHSGSKRYVLLLMWMRLGQPVLSMREAVLTVSVALIKGSMVQTTFGHCILVMLSRLFMPIVLRLACCQRLRFACKELAETRPTPFGAVRTILCAHHLVVQFLSDIGNFLFWARTGFCSSHFWP